MLLIFNEGTSAFDESQAPRFTNYTTEPIR
jgi:hypothetical protein